MPGKKEIEIKFWVKDSRQLSAQARSAGFHLVTKATHETNTLYDLPGNPVRRRGELLRIRRYGKQWVLTHKAKALPGRHKSRMETEITMKDGDKMHAILTALGFKPVFRYEKFRSEWKDAHGHLVMDRTPMGNLAELEGPSAWIDRTAKVLRVCRKDYITKSYAALFADWKKKSRSTASEMTFAEVRRYPPRLP